MIVASLASIPTREAMLAEVVETILPQVDVLNVCLNGYPHVPDYLYHDRINVHFSQQNMGPLGKFLWSARPNCYHLTIDDDIVYPDDYATIMIAAVERYGRKALITTAGLSFYPDTTSYIRDRIRYRPMMDIAEDLRVMVGGTGSMAWHTDLGTSDMFKSIVMPMQTDPSIALWAFTRGIKIFVLKRPAGWANFMPHPAPGLNERYGLGDDSQQTEMVQQIARDSDWFNDNNKRAVPKYVPEQYWTERLGKFGVDDYRGAGMKGWKPDEAKRKFNEAATQLSTQLLKWDINLRGKRVLEIGTGNGYYTAWLWERGIISHTGIDVTDVLHDELRKRFPRSSFIKQDITTGCPRDKFDLIMMIDVTQHITDDAKWLAAMRNVERVMLGWPGAEFIVTTWDSPDCRNSYYEKSRPAAMYRAAFKAWCKISEPMPFRDKFILRISR